MRTLFLLSLLIAFFAIAQAGFFDDLSSSLNEKLNNAKDWVTDVAAPAISDTASDVSATVQDPETHRSIKNWFVKKYEDASDFTNENIVPALKKGYENAAEVVHGSDNNE